MARLAATAVLLLSLLALANCRVLEAEPETVVAISDEQQGQADPAVLQETDAAEAIPSLPTVTVAEGVLRLPSNRRPCHHGFLHRLIRWARHHGGLSHRRSAFAGAGEARVVPAFLPEEPRQAELEAVAEPDPDTRPDTDGEQKPFHGEEEVDGEENESVKAWKREMLRRFRAHGLHFHHLHHHQEHAAGENDDSDVQEQQNKAEGVAAVYANLLSRQFHHYHHGDHQEQENKEEGAADMQRQHVKLFSRHFHHHHGEEEQEQKDKEQGAERVPVELPSRPFHHHNHGDEEQEETARKHFFHHHHHMDSENEVDEVEELARKLSKAIIRRSFSRGGMRHHHHHGHAEEGGVKKWFKGVMNMNRF
jgi:hypothetical protein